MTLNCILIPYQGIVAAFQKILRTFDLVIVSLQDDVLTTKNGVLQSEGLVQVSDYCWLSSDQTIVLSAHLIAVSMQGIARPLDHIRALCCVGFWRGVGEETVAVEETVEGGGLFGSLLECWLHVGEEGLVARILWELDSFRVGDHAEQKKQGQEDRPACWSICHDMNFRLIEYNVEKVGLVFL